MKSFPLIETNTHRCSTVVWLALGMLCLVGCGTTREYTATEQLVMSDAVDRSINGLDFRPLTGEKVYLDSSYLRQVKGQGFVNAEYVTSALRQQVAAAGCLLQDTQQEADVIIEARIGALGSDNHRVTYGIPENNSLSSAARLIPGAPNIPTLPEIALARREARESTAKVAAFAYDRQSRQVIWQSGVNHSLATARDTWVLGVGPFQGGTIREQTKLAGSALKFGEKTATGSPAKFYERPEVDHSAEVRFQEGLPIFDDGGFEDDMIGIPAAEIAAAIEQASPSVKMESSEQELAGKQDPSSAPAAEIAEAGDEQTIQR